MNTETAPTIAVVDDHDLVREAISKTLSILGFNVIIKAANGKDFLLQTANAPLLPDLCLLDIDMPIMNGAQTAVCAKTLWPDMKILAHTFNSNETEAVIINGADVCMSKGCSMEELKAKLLELYGAKTCSAEIKSFIL